MIVALDATIHEIAELGGMFKWPEYHCEHCSRRMWGHGFVGRYFESIPICVRIKRLICPVCGVVAVFRPKSFWPRFRSPIESIFEALLARLGSGYWPEGFKRQRGWYWLKKLMSSVLMSGHANPGAFLQERFNKEIYFFT